MINIFHTINHEKLSIVPQRESSIPTLTSLITNPFFSSVLSSSEKQSDRSVNG